MTEDSTSMLLIRHADSSPSRNSPESDWPLSDLGRRQAATLADSLAGTEIAAVASSPYLRALDTVRPLADRSGRSVAVRDDLRERKLCDSLRDDWLDLLRKAWDDFAFALPDCESGCACQRRVRKCLADLAQEHEGLTIAVCSHGNAIGLFLNSIDPSFGFRQWAGMTTPDMFRIVWQGGRPEWKRQEPRTGAEPDIGQPSSGCATSDEPSM